MRQDILKVYRALHTWVGIVAALFLFIGFYAGAITMFKEPLRRWASGATELPPPPGLADAPELIRRTLATHPEARRSYTIHLETSAATPARLTWAIRDPAADEHHAEPRTFGAGLDAAGALVVRELHPAPVAQFIDNLHRRLGLPLDHEIAMPFTAAVALLYFLALASGVVLLAPTLVKSLFLLRTGGRSVRRMWLDVHNTLGFLSLPFHLVIALTVVVFALHDEFYALQDKVLFGGRIAAATTAARPPVPRAAAETAGPLLAPLELQSRLAAQAPGFRLQRIEYTETPAGPMARVFGGDDRHVLRGPTFGIGTVDARTGELRSTDYFPGRQPAGLATVTAFFALHFGNYGGAPVRWAYVALGLSGAFLFYTGNLLWIEARRKRAAEAAGAAAVVQSRTTRRLAALTVGVCHGAMAGISLTLAAARWLPGSAELLHWHEAIFYAVLVLALGWAFRRGAARAGHELLWVCAAATLAIPLGSALGVLAGIGHPYAGPLAVDATALGAAVVFAGLARLARRRAHHGPRDSVWAAAG